MSFQCSALQWLSANELEFELWLCRSQCSSSPPRYSEQVPALPYLIANGASFGKKHGVSSLTTEILQSAGKPTGAEEEVVFAWPENAESVQGGQILACECSCQREPRSAAHELIFEPVEFTLFTWLLQYLRFIQLISCDYCATLAA